MHCSVLKSEDPPVPTRCSKCCVKFHCPFCPPTVYKPRHDAYSINKHLQCHLKHAIRQRGYIICMCHLGCRLRAHFHCPFCGKTVLRKDGAHSHIGSCQGKIGRCPSEEKLHPCSDCGETFKSKYHLSYHQRTHTIDPPTSVQEPHTTDPPTSVLEPHTTDPLTSVLEPHTTDPPTSLQKPHTTDPLTSAKEPHTTDPPTSAKEPHTTEPPTSVQEPHTTDHPTPVQEPHTTDPPSAVQHCSVLKSEDPPVPTRCSKCCVKFHCPFCTPTIYKPRHDAYSINKHLQCHLKHAIRQKGYVICMCNLGCRPRGHFHCPLCGKTVLRKDDAHSHIGSCQGTSHPTSVRAASHLCCHCGKILKSRRNLVDHLRTHTGEKPYLCSSCGKQFSSLCSFSAHRKSHSVERPHRCPACGKSFKRRSEFLTHQRRHTGEKPYLCSTCGKRLASAKTFSTHQKTHTLDRPHHCLTCGKSFVLRSTLLAHQGAHTRQYHCSQCGKDFGRSDNLKVHQRTHDRQQS